MSTRAELIGPGSPQFPLWQKEAYKSQGISKPTAIQMSLTGSTTDSQKRYCGGDFAPLGNLMLQIVRVLLTF